MGMQRLRVSNCQRFLIKEDGTPFFWLGDTAWELFHKLNKEEANLYLQNRAELQFTVIQAVALAESQGITTPNAYGRLPLKQNRNGYYDPSLPDTDNGYDYWQHVDYIIDRAAELGLYIALLPAWGDKFHAAWGKGPEIFNADNAYSYGRWIGERYRDRSNLVWVLGGDRALKTMKHFEVIHALAAGLREGDGGVHLITFHPKGSESSSDQVHEEPWLDFNMIQSGHGDAILSNYTFIERDYRKIPHKPTFDAEPCYEDHPIGFKPANGYFDAADVRKAAYYAVFAGGFGHTYGHHSIWSMTIEPTEYFPLSWKDALYKTGASQMRHLRCLIESRPMLGRIPDQGLIVNNYQGANYMSATRGDTYAFVYFPNGLPAEIAMGVLPGERVSAAWFDPRNGTSQPIGEYDNKQQMKFNPPSSGRGEDWVLIIDCTR